MKFSENFGTSRFVRPWRIAIGCLQKSKLISKRFYTISYIYNRNITFNNISIAAIWILVGFSHFKTFSKFDKILFSTFSPNSSIIKSWFSLVDSSDWFIGVIKMESFALTSHSGSSFFSIMQGFLASSLNFRRSNDTPRLNLRKISSAFIPSMESQTKNLVLIPSAL